MYSDWRAIFVVLCVGPPGVYSPDVAGLYMGDQHMMRPPGKIKAHRVNDSVAVFVLRVSRVH